MESGLVLDILKQMLFLVMAGVSIIVLPGLVVGLLVAIFQAATQVNEMTLSFLPKLFVMMLVIAGVSPWLINNLVTFTQQLIIDIPTYIS